MITTIKTGGFTSVVENICAIQEHQGEFIVHLPSGPIRLIAEEAEEFTKQWATSTSARD